MLQIKFILLGFMGMVSLYINKDLPVKANINFIHQDTLLQRTISELEPILLKRESLNVSINKKQYILDSLRQYKSTSPNNLSEEKSKLIDKLDAYILNKILADYKSFKNLDKQLLNKKISSFSNDIFKLTEEFSKKSNVPDVVNIQINELTQEIEKLKDAYAKEQNTLSVHEIKLNKLLLQENREYFDIVFYGNTYKVFIANTQKHTIKIHHNASGVLQPIRYTLNQWTEVIKPVFIMNAGMYNEDGSPVGLLIQENRQINPLDINQATIPDNFHMYPNGVFYMHDHKFFVSQTSEFRKLDPDFRSDIQYGTQSGPMLVINGKIHPKFTFLSKNTNIRNGVGIVKDSQNEQVVLIISESKVNLYEFALLFQFMFKCDNALYLDGAISKAYYSNNGRVDGSLGGNLGPTLSVKPKNN
jgi:uncharacterized protein YigE (DUF2233 family)